MCRQCGDVTAFQFDNESNTVRTRWRIPNSYINNLLLQGQVVFTDLVSAQRLTASVQDNVMCCSS